MPHQKNLSSSYPARPSGRAVRASSEDASIDDILASIREIMDEEPITTRSHLEATAANFEPQRRNKTGSARAPRISSPLPVRQHSLTPPIQLEVKAQPDDVLDELLEPEGIATPPKLKLDDRIAEIDCSASTAVSIAPGPKPVATEGTAVAAAPRDDEASQLVHEPVDAMTAVHAPTALLPDSSAILERPRIATPPEDEMRAAADVLGALAAGLAANERAADITLLPAEPAAQPAIVVRKTTTESQPPAAVGEGIDGVTSPTSVAAAAVAAAVAEVAAANAASSSVRKDETRSAHTVDISTAAVIEPTIDNAAPPAAPNGDQPTVDVDVDVPSAEPVNPADANQATDVVVCNAADDDVPVSASQLTEVAPKSFEDAIAGMLRPLLREWLDENLPRMVEKALHEEISEAGLLPARPQTPARKSA